MQHVDTIIIGAGHNGLVCAAYLARSDQRMLVLEAGDIIGGLAATRAFHPGGREARLYEMLLNLSGRGLDSRFIPLFSVTASGPAAKGLSRVPKRLV